MSSQILPDSNDGASTNGDWAQQPGSLGKRIPMGVWDGSSEPLSDDEIYELFFEWVSSARNITPWPHQEEAILSLLSGDHVIVNTPTGSGKSLIALGMHAMALCQGKISYYTAPIKALVSEKFFELVSILGPRNVGMITGDTHINAQAPVICCTAEILANKALREGEKADIGCVAMDEFHYYGDPDRGWAWQVPLLTLPHTQFLLMSATLGDVSSIAANLEKHTHRHVTNVSDAPRPVPLSYEYVDTALPNTIELLLRGGKTPIYIVHFSQDAALETAQSLSSLGVTDREQRDAIKEAVKGTAFTTAFGKILKRLLLTGVGVHHAGMLPRYRRLVEQLAQQGLLPVICGTDTLGVGINVPIHAVLFTALTKYDGRRQRRLRAREFHQIAGRAGRSGFDTEGLVVALAPEYEIENAKAVAKAGNDPKKLKKVKRKKAPEGFVNWSKATYDKLIESAPETLIPHLRITHSIVLSEISQGGNAWKRVKNLIEESEQSPDSKAELVERAAQLFQTLMDSGVVEKWELDDGSMDYSLTIDMPDDFALDQPLSPFLLACLELLDPENPDYALDVISMVEATLDDPRQVLRAQERKARDAAMLEMKDEGLDYDERMEKLAEITYPKPLEEIMEPAFEQYKRDIPWAADCQLACKSVVRDMVESANDFSQYIGQYGISRSEGTLLRYLSDAYRALSRTVPVEKRNEQLEDIIEWLGLIVRGIDSSLVDEWESSAALDVQMRQNVADSTDTQFSALSAAPPQRAGEVVKNRRGLTVLVRNALFHRVQLMALDNPQALADLDGDWGMHAHDWEDTLDDFYEDHDEILTDADARSSDYLMIDTSREKTHHTWHVRQIISDIEGDHDWAIDGTINLDETQEASDVSFLTYDVGRVEDLVAKD